MVFKLGSIFGVVQALMDIYEKEFHHFPRVPSNIIVNYKSFKVMARINSKLVPVANVTADLDVEWLDNNIVNEEVSGAMTNFMSDLE